MATLKELAATSQIVTQVALERSLTELKKYIDAQDAAGGAEASQAIANIQEQINALVGTEADVDKVINTFNEVKAFLADYSEDDTLKSLIDSAINAATAAAATAETNAKAYADGLVETERTRAQGAEGGLDTRLTTIENVEVMSDQQAKTLFDGIFTPTEGGE